jgi:hypothetical protein
MLDKRKSIAETIHRPLGAAYDLASKVMACNMLLEDATEGIDAFLPRSEQRAGAGNDGKPQPVCKFRVADTSEISKVVLR